jgi:transcriptional regulator with XRE-family HTH domain
VNDLVEQLRPSFDADQDYRASYAESFMNSWVAAQIKVLREQRNLSQQELADLIGTKQAGISRLENTNYSSWKVQTLARIARALDVRLRISFEEFGTLPEELFKFGRDFLKRESYCKDGVFKKEITANITRQPSENERKALAPNNEVPRVHLVSVPAKKNVDSEKKANASHLDTTRESPRIRRVGGAQPESKSPPSDDGPEASREMPVFDLSKGAEALRTG